MENTIKNPDNKAQEKTKLIENLLSGGDDEKEDRKQLLEYKDDEGAAVIFTIVAAAAAAAMDKAENIPHTLTQTFTIDITDEKNPSQPLSQYIITKKIIVVDDKSIPYDYSVKKVNYYESDGKTPLNPATTEDLDETIVQNILTTLANCSPNDDDDKIKKRQDTLKILLGADVKLKCSTE